MNEMATFLIANVPLPTSLPTLPKILGKNIAIKIDLMIWAPMINGNNNFFSPNAKNPNPKPVRNEFLPKPNRPESRKANALLSLRHELQDEDVHK